MYFKKITIIVLLLLLASPALAKKAREKFSHKGIKEAAECKTCHETKTQDDDDTNTPLNFSHKNHIERVGGDCLMCHEKIAKKKLPTHKECLLCHQGDYDALSCKKCHSDLGSMNLVPISDFSHSAGWMERHRSYSGRKAAVCAQCHEESYCSNCHNQRDEMTPAIKYPEDVERRFIHRADFITRHSIEARANSALCLRCHDNQSCMNCHVREGVDTGAANYPHPAGWMSAGSTKFHGRVAKQDIVLCASCHEKGGATNCIVCHTAGSGNNPHPPGWTTSVSINSPVCQRCH